MISVKELKQFLGKLKPDDRVGIDEGGLILYTEEMDAYIEIGGLPDDDASTICEEHIDFADPNCEACQQEWKEQTGDKLGGKS